MMDVAQLELVQETPFRWRIEQHGEMRVAGRVFASSALLSNIATDEALRQVANVATLPGIVEASYAMPDIHWGYGFPIGGVAATDVAAGGVVSPGGVGFDFSCGVRLLVSQLGDRDIAPRLGALMDSLSRRIPRGMGKGAVWSLGSADELADLMRTVRRTRWRTVPVRMLILLGARTAARCRVPSQTGERASAQPGAASGGQPR